MYMKVIHFKLIHLDLLIEFKIFLFKR